MTWVSYPAAILTAEKKSGGAAWSSSQRTCLRRAHVRGRENAKLARAPRRECRELVPKDAHAIPLHEGDQNIDCIRGAKLPPDLTPHAQVAGAIHQQIAVAQRQ